MAKADTSPLATGTVDLPEWGPKMLALPNDRWRNFVALYSMTRRRAKDFYCMPPAKSASERRPLPQTH